MSDLKLPGEDKNNAPSLTRIAIWVIVGGIALYMLISGIIGIVAAG